MFFKFSFSLLFSVMSSLAVAASPTDEDCAKRIDLTEEIAKPIFNKYLESKVNKFFKDLYRDSLNIELPDSAISHSVTFEEGHPERDSNSVLVLATVAAGSYSESFSIAFSSPDSGYGNESGRPYVKVIRDELKRTVGYLCLSKMVIFKPYPFPSNDFGVFNSESQYMGSVLLEERPSHKVEKPW